jgi:hypothetical protein
VRKVGGKAKEQEKHFSLRELRRYEPYKREELAERGEKENE